jgi:hypothetical protein
MDARLLAEQCNPDDRAGGFAEFRALRKFKRQDLEP